MKKILMALVGIYPLLLYGQVQNSIIFGESFQASYLSELQNPIIYSSVESFDAEYGISKTRLGAIYRIKKDYPLSIRMEQFGYIHFRESKYSISTSRQLSKVFAFGVNMNYHHRYISAPELDDAWTIDLSTSYLQERYALYVLLENPLGIQFENGNLPESIQIFLIYNWGTNIKSELKIKHEQELGIGVEHVLNFKLHKQLSASLFQILKPWSQGCRIGFQKNHLWIFTQYEQGPWKGKTSIGIIYSLNHE